MAKRNGGKGSAPKPKSAKTSPKSGSTKVGAAKSGNAKGSNGPIAALVGPANWRNDDLGTWGKVAWFTLLVVAFLVPVALGTLRPFGINVTFANDIFDTFKVFILRIGIGLALFAWVVDTFWKGGKVRTSPIFWVFLAFLAWAGVSTLLSISPATAFFGKYRRYDGLWSFWLYGAALFLTVQYANRGGRVKQLAQTVTAASALIAIYGLFQAAGMDVLNFQSMAFEANRSFSTYGNPDLLAGYLAFGIFIPLGLALVETSTAKRALYWAVFLLSAVVSITAFSRSIWVGSAVGFIAIVVFALRQRVAWSGVDWTMSGAAGGAGLLVVLRSLGSESAVMNFVSRLSSIFNFSDGSASTRFMIWDAASQAIAQRPIFGFGPDTFRLIFRRFQPDGYAQLAGYRSVADNVHDYPLQLAAGVGIPGALLFYGGIAWAAVTGAATCWRLPEAEASATAQRAERGSRLLLAGFWAASAAYVTHLMFGLSLPATTFLLFMSMGALLAPTAKSVDVPAPKGLTIPVIAALAGVIVLVASVGLSSTMLYADKRFADGAAASQYGQQAYQARQDSTAEAYLNDAAEHMAVSVALSPFNDQYRYDLYTAKTALASMAALSNSANSTAYIADAVAFGRDMVARNPWEYDNIVKVIDFYNQLAGYGIADYLADAETLGSENVALMPNGLAMRFVYANTLKIIGRADEAAAQLEYAIAGDSNFAEAQTMLSEITATTTETAK